MSSAGHVLLATDKFKGSLTAAEATARLAAGLQRAVPGLGIRTIPVADGGEGTVDAAVEAGFARVLTRATGPTGAPIEAEFAVRGDTAVIEVAEASGLRRLPRGEAAPLSATSYGTGELIRAALDAGCTRIILGLGGSACTDGGAGLVQALGGRLLDDAGDELPRGGAALARLARVDLTGMAAIRELIVASDVDNPLLGPNGAAAVYGPQKGATREDVALLDAALANWARVVREAVAGRGSGSGPVPGRASAAGSGGGIGAGQGSAPLPGGGSGDSSGGRAGGSGPAAGFSVATGAGSESGLGSGQGSAPLPGAGSVFGGAAGGSCGGLGSGRDSVPVPGAGVVLADAAAASGPVGSALGGGAVDFSGVGAAAGSPVGSAADFAVAPGAGAAGGIGFAALALLGARLEPGIEIVLDLADFASKAAGARLIITGEGSLDPQSLRGKAPAGVARAAARIGVPVVAVAGVCSLTPAELEAAGIRAAYTLSAIEPDLDRCVLDAGPLLERLAAEVVAGAAS